MMALVNRSKTTKEECLGILKSFYKFLLFPILVFVGVEMLLTRESLNVYFFFTVWILIFASIWIFIYRAKSRLRRLKKIVSNLKKTEYFCPDRLSESYQQVAGRYMGIDANNGTILYVHLIRKGIVDIVGLTMEDWTNREVEGKLFRLYTKNPELPRIEIATPWAQRWYDTLGAMEHKQYSPPRPFAEYVRGHIEALERDNSIHIPKIA